MIVLSLILFLVDSSFFFSFSLVSLLLGNVITTIGMNAMHGVQLQRRVLRIPIFGLVCPFDSFVLWADISFTSEL